MLFRPSFCANCGEKIERADWHLWTSRRFCVVCESQFKGHDLVPRFIVGLGVLTGIFGFGSYLKSSPAATGVQPIRQPRRIAEQTSANAQDQRNAVPSMQNNSAAATSATPASQNTGPAAKPNDLRPTGTPGTKQAATPDEPVYYCGAETKKGKPCTRRVKGYTRCFQHTGMPAMLPAEKLRIK